MTYNNKSLTWACIIHTFMKDILIIKLSFIYSFGANLFCNF